MKKLLVAMFLCLGFSFSVSAARVVDLPLRTNRVAVQQMYDVLSDANVDAKDTYLGLSTDLQADLWTLQLEHFLAANPELTPEQYSVVAETIGLLSTGIHHRRRTSSAEAAHATESLRLLTARIKSAFTREEGAVFGQLGYSAVDRSVSSLASSGDQSDPSDEKRNRAIRSNAPAGSIISNGECNCNSEDDWCYWGYMCIPRPLSCTRTPAGCGTLWEKGCNGLCE